MINPRVRFGTEICGAARIIPAEAEPSIAARPMGST
jgi:hypothetical protein